LELDCFRPLEIKKAIRQEADGMEQILLTPEEVADILRVTPDDVVALVQDGSLAGAKVRGQWRITQESLTDFLSENLRAQNVEALHRKLEHPESWISALEKFPDVAAFSGPNRPPIPTQIGYPFRSKPATVPEHSGHPCFLGLSRS
jgi:excisionase family DNA binding protein